MGLHVVLTHTVLYDERAKGCLAGLRDWLRKPPIRCERHDSHLCCWKWACLLCCCKTWGALVALSLLSRLGPMRTTATSTSACAARLRTMDEILSKIDVPE